MTQQLYRGLDVKPVVVVGTAGIDSNGDALPASFDSEVVDESVPGTTTITMTKGADVWVQTITVVGGVTTILLPVKQ